MLRENTGHYCVITQNRIFGGKEQYQTFFIEKVMIERNIKSSHINLFFTSGNTM